MRALTWNVLHRVHGENFAEACLARWADEAARVRGVVAWLQRTMGARAVDVAVLQEVSGDVLAALRVAFAGHEVLQHQYPRVPRPKVPSGSVRDATEHLVVVAPRGARVARSATYDSDPGKGFLLVTVPGQGVVGSTHVKWGDAREGQLRVLASAVREVGGRVAVGGDFNATRDVVAPHVGEDVSWSEAPVRGLRTRPDARGGADIDLWFCRGGVVRDAVVLEVDELSDHRAVVAEFDAA